MMTRKLVLAMLIGVGLLTLSNNAFGHPGPDRFHHHRPLIIPPPERPIIIRPPHGIIIEPTIIFNPSKTNSEPTKKETVTVWITNDNGSKSAVTLIKDPDGPGYTGPKGEYYSSMPTEDQLKVLYGIGSTTAKKTSITVWITNDNGSKTPVTLTLSDAGFWGPSGEYYASMPTEEQLKVLYGLRSEVSTESSLTIWLDSNDAKIPVVLMKDGTEYIGPNGEHYQSLPTKEQLKMVYGQKSLKADSGTSVTIWIDNTDGTKMPITLQKEGTAFIGPAGEKYSTLPTKEQLKLLYSSDSKENEQDELSFVIKNKDGKETIVTLKKDGSEFVGPKGERYPSIPAEEQLKLIYGK
jgi:hypothetical protein